MSASQSVFCEIIKPSDEDIEEFSRPERSNLIAKTDSKLAKLGELLFFEPILSGSNWISCATCHNPALNWGDGLAKGFGHGMKPLKRKTPTLWDIGLGRSFFWDGRVKRLKQQVLMPIVNVAEMNQDPSKLVEELSSISKYKDLFKQTFKKSKDPLNIENITAALVAFVNTIVSNDSKFDLWIKGEAQLTEDEGAGFLLFKGKAKCVACHQGWRFTDEAFHDIGVKTMDRGRGLVSDNKKLNFSFKTPTLRNILDRYPYMHNGSEATIEDVIELYDMGGRVKRPTLSNEISALKLSDAEKKQLKAFLSTLHSVEIKSIHTLPR